MLTPRWVRSRSQPIALDDVLEYLARSPTVPSKAAPPAPGRRSGARVGVRASRVPALHSAAFNLGPLPSMHHPRPAPAEHRNGSLTLRKGDGTVCAESAEETPLPPLGDASSPASPNGTSASRLFLAGARPPNATVGAARSGALGYHDRTSVGNPLSGDRGNPACASSPRQGADTMHIRKIGLNASIRARRSLGARCVQRPRAFPPGPGAGA